MLTNPDLILGDVFLKEFLLSRFRALFWWRQIAGRKHSPANVLNYLTTSVRECSSTKIQIISPNRRPSRANLGIFMAKL